MKDVRNLPFALNHPIFIFNSKTQPTSKVVITDLKSNNVNLLIALQIDFKEKDAIVISIRSIYPKESQQSILNWVNEGLLVWRDKKKALKFSSKLQSNSAEVRGTTLKKSLGCNTPNNSVFQHGLSSVENKSHFSLIDSFYKEESGRSCSSLPKDTTNTNDMQQFMDEIIEKSKKGAPIGTERTYSNGKTYIRANLLE